MKKHTIHLPISMIERYNSISDIFSLLHFIREFSTSYNDFISDDSICKVSKYAVGQFLSELKNLNEVELKVFADLDPYLVNPESIFHDLNAIKPIMFDKVKSNFTIKIITQNEFRRINDDLFVSNEVFLFLNKNMRKWIKLGKVPTRVISENVKKHLPGLSVTEFNKQLTDYCLKYDINLKKNRQSKIEGKNRRCYIFNFDFPKK